MEDLSNCASQAMDILPESGTFDDVFSNSDAETEEKEKEKEKEKAVLREPLINRIDSLRETRIKVGRLKTTSLKRHMRPNVNSLQNSCFTLEFSGSDLAEVQIPTKRGLTLKQTALPYFVAHKLPDFFAYEFFLMGSKSALPLHAQSDHLTGSKIVAKKKDPQAILEARSKERKMRGSTGVSPSTSSSNLAVPLPDFPRSPRRASLGFLVVPPSPRAGDQHPKETAEGLSIGRLSSGKLSHAESLQHLVFKDFEHPEMPSGSLPRLKQPSNKISRITRILSPSKERLDRLSDTLEAFNMTGIPLTWSPTVNPNKFHVKLKWLDLERTWEDIVINSQTLSEHEKVQQAVIWELFSTEANYIRNLKAVVDTHISALHYLQSSTERFLGDVDSQKLFANFEEIYVANGLFWKNHFLKTLKTARRTRSPLKIDDLYDGFIRIARLFSPYISFCIDTNSCHHYLREKKDSSSLFAKFMRWADQKIISDFNKEGFRDLLSKPFQRITRYKLLLDRIKEQSSDEEERNKLTDMTSSVASFVQDVNDRVEATQKYEELVDLGRKLEFNIPLDSPGEEYSRVGERFVTFNLLQPMTHNNNFRELLCEGPLRFRDKDTKWVDLHCFVLTDMLLLAKAKRGSQDRCKVFRPPIKLDRIIIEKMSESPLQFVFNILDDFGFLRTMQAVMGQMKRLQEMIAKIEEAKTALVQCATGINRFKVSETLLLETSPPSLVPTVSGVQTDSITSSVHTLSITDLRRRFRDPKGSDSAPPSNLASAAFCNSASSLDNEDEVEAGDEEEEEEEEGEREGEGCAEDGELVLMDSCSLSPCSRQGSRFLRTASPVQRKQQQLRVKNCSPPHDPADSPLDDIPSDMAFRNRRGSRGDRRYRTADSLLPPRSHSIHKRLSLNYRGHAAEGSGQLPPHSPTAPGLPATSVESFQSSSGFSSSGSVQHLHSGSELSEPGGGEAPEVGSPPGSGMCVLQGRDRAKKINARHCMSLNDLSRLGLDPISDTNDNDEDSPEGNSSSTSVRSVRKQYFVVQSSDGEGTDV